MAGSHVILFRGVTRLQRTAVCGNAFPPSDEYTHQCAGIDDFSLFPDVMIGNRIVMFVTGKIDAVVLTHGKTRIIFYFKCLTGGKFFLSRGGCSSAKNFSCLQYSFCCMRV